MTLLNGGLAHALTPAFSSSVACKDRGEIDRYREKWVKAGGGWFRSSSWMRRFRWRGSTAPQECYAGKGKGQ